jgi:hypothetical protein
MGWQKVSGYNSRAKAETAIARWKRVIGDGLRARKDQHRVTEMKVGVYVLNVMLTLGRPELRPDRLIPKRHRVVAPCVRSMHHSRGLCQQDRNCEPAKQPRVSAKRLRNPAQAHSAGSPRSRFGISVSSRGGTPIMSLAPLP